MFKSIKIKLFQLHLNCNEHTVTNLNKMQAFKDSVIVPLKKQTGSDSGMITLRKKTYLIWIWIMTHQLLYIFVLEWEKNVCVRIPGIGGE